MSLCPLVSSPFIIVNHLPQKAKAELPHLELFQSFSGFINSSSNINSKRGRSPSLHPNPSVTPPVKPTSPESTYQVSNPPVQVIEIENAEGEIKGKNGYVWHTKIDHTLPRAGRISAKNILRIQKKLKGAARNAVIY